MNNKLIAKELLTIAKDMICLDTLKIARGQGRIRDEIQESEAECLKALKIPKELKGINLFYVGDFQLHHMDPSKKFKLNGEMTKNEFENNVKQIENGVLDKDLQKFKEELDTVVFIPGWFHRTIHSKNFNPENFPTRQSLYNEMARILIEEFDSIEKLKFQGEEIRDWLDVLKELKNTIYLNTQDYEEVKKLLIKVREIIVKNIKEVL